MCNRNMLIIQCMQWPTKLHGCWASDTVHTHTLSLSLIVHTSDSTNFLSTLLLSGVRYIATFNTCIIYIVTVSTTRFNATSNTWYLISLLSCYRSAFTVTPWPKVIKPSELSSCEKVEVDVPSWQSVSVCGPILGPDRFVTGFQYDFIYFLCDKLQKWFN